MTLPDLQDLLLKNTATLAELQTQVSQLVSKEQRVGLALSVLRTKLEAWLLGFHRDKYKSTDQRLFVHALAEEILIFVKLGYDVGSGGSLFLLGVAALLEGRNQTALDYFKQFAEAASPDDRNRANVQYLSAMICYNRKDYHGAIQHFEAAFENSPHSQRDWQCKIYVGELQFFLRHPAEQLERTFDLIEQSLRVSDGMQNHSFLRASAHLKWGNCYMGHLDLPPKESNFMANVQVALGHYKLARKFLPPHPDPESLLPVVVDYSLAQALLLARSVDMSLAMTPSELLADVFERLRRIVLTKREEIILAQSYFMLGTCGCYSPHVSKDAAEIYLAYARHQTLNVPSDICFYSCVTKELLSRDEFVRQIDFFANQLEQSNQWR
ncbi:MAG: tetratricopeptide repeat protein [Verrucomicrobia subdivision 3 bacterium]|nr:tetratricopeptide repeat protein [Limisphaerales bacterium]